MDVEELVYTSLFLAVMATGATCRDLTDGIALEALPIQRASSCRRHAMPCELGFHLARLDLRTSFKELR